MAQGPVPNELPNWIEGKQQPARAGELLDKRSPVSGEILYRYARSRVEDVEDAVRAARAAQPAWAQRTPPERGQLLHEIVIALRDGREGMAQVVALETGKSLREARAETEAAIAQGLFMAGEGQRLYGRTTTSGTPNKMNLTVRQPIGVAGLIIAANTPIANIAWKVFPALICGNAAVLKSAEDTPGTAWLFARLAHEAGLPSGVLNLVHGLGAEAGGPIVEHPDVGIVSFTGSSTVGRQIASMAGARLARVSLELGGKNPFVVCDDADLDASVQWAALSAFSNAGQRCASAGRIIVFEGVYERFRELFLDQIRALRVGAGEDDDLGPVINLRQLERMLSAVEGARRRGAVVLIGGERLLDPELANGFFMAPTLIEGAAPDDEISTTELFGPIACLYRASDFEEALSLANHSPYGLTAAIHTQSVHRALEFCERVEAGVVVVNGGTHGSEPHMPFGGRKQSGNGSREPGTEALDVYSELKNISLNFDPAHT